MNIRYGLLLILAASAVPAQDVVDAAKPLPPAGVFPKVAPVPPLPPLPPISEDMIAAAKMAGLAKMDMALAGADKVKDVALQIRWMEDAKMLQAVAAPGGKGPLSDDEQMKLMAVETLMRTDPDRAIPLVDKLLQNTSASTHLRQRALAALSQSDSPKAREIVTQIAKGERGSELQPRAVQYLASRGRDNAATLTAIYSASTDIGVKKQILRGWMNAGDRDQLLKAAKTESNQDLRMEAVQLLGAMGSETQLGDLYAAEQSVQVRERILRALMHSGSAQKLIEIAKTEKDPGLRERAIQYLGAMNSAAAQEALVSMYSSVNEPSTRAAILRAFAAGGNAKELIAAARKETSPDLKRTAVQHLAHMKTKEASDFLMELLEK